MLATTARRRGALLAGGLLIAAVGAGLGLWLSLGSEESHAAQRDDVPFGFWVTDKSSADDAAAQVAAKAGFDPVIPDPASLPPATELRAIGADLPQTGGIPLTQITVDYFPPNSKDAEPGALQIGYRISITETNSESKQVQPGTPFDVGSGYQALRFSDPNAAAGTAGYLIVGKGMTFLVSVWGKDPPTFEQTLPMLRSLAR